jgi:hypothetical protein
MSKKISDKSNFFFLEKYHSKKGCNIENNTYQQFILKKYKGWSQNQIYWQNIQIPLGLSFLVRQTTP